MTIRPVGVEFFHVNGRTDGRTDGQTDRQTGRQTDRHTDMTKLIVTFRNPA